MIGVLYENYKYKNINKILLGNNYTPTINNLFTKTIINMKTRKIRKVDQMRFEEILSEGGCYFVKNGIKIDFMDLYRMEDFDRDYYRLSTKDSSKWYFNPPYHIMIEMYLKFKKEGCIIKF